MLIILVSLSTIRKRTPIITPHVTLTLHHTFRILFPMMLPNPIVLRHRHIPGLIIVNIILAGRRLMTYGHSQQTGQTHNYQCY
ncbi:hypothetical protein Hanom_Chr16g01425681 [Helianthus anomalus]